MISAGRFGNARDTFSQSGKITALTLQNDTPPHPHSDEKDSTALLDGDDISHSAGPSAAPRRREASLIVIIHHELTKLGRRRRWLKAWAVYISAVSCGETTARPPGQVQRVKLLHVGFQLSQADLSQRRSRSGIFFGWGAGVICRKTNGYKSARQIQNGAPRHVCNPWFFPVLCFDHRNE